MVSGYLNSFQDGVASLAHCIDNYVPGVLKWAEMYDIAGLIAPRPLFVESGGRTVSFRLKPVSRALQTRRDSGRGELLDSEFTGDWPFRSSRSLLAMNLPLLSRRLQLPIPLGMNLVLTPVEHVLRSDVARGTAQADVVVMLDVALHKTSRIVQ
jgi:hypothetical protein